MKIIAIIPARYASSRFEGKPLAKIGEKTMIQRVYEQVAQSKVDSVYIATDDQRILEEVQTFTPNVLMTKTTHRSGTDRCAEALMLLQKEGKVFDVVLNVQGDEPFIQPSQIDTLIHLFAQNEQVKIGTLVKKIKDEKNIQNPNIVKVVFNQKQEALYFSRYPIPYLRDEATQRHDFYKHIGMYAFRSESLVVLAALSPSSLELAESLEQLRWLQAGHTVHIAKTTEETKGIDTPEDLAEAITMYQKYL